jgi:hypothetical protein
MSQDRAFVKRGIVSDDVGRGVRDLAKPFDHAIPARPPCVHGA